MARSCALLPALIALLAALPVQAQVEHGVPVHGAAPDDLVGVSADALRDQAFELLPASAGAPRVQAFEIVGDEDEALFELVAVEPGLPLSRRAVRRSVQRLYETGRFANVSARAAPLDGGVLVRFFVEPRRTISAIEFAGLHQIEEPAALRASGLSEGQEWGLDRLERARAGLLAAYARRGYEQVQVEAVVDDEGPGVELTFAVREGPPTRLAAIRFEGDAGDPAMVQSAISLGPGAVLDRLRLEAELEALRSAWRAAGHYRALMGSPRVEQVVPGLAEVVVEVDAGPKIDFAFRGNRTYSAAQLRNALAWDGSELLDEPMIRDLAARIERAYRLAGWYDARVHTSETQRDDGSAARVTFHVEEGRPLYLAEVRFEGNRMLRDAALREVAEQVVLARRGTESLLVPLEADELDAAIGVSARRGRRALRPLHVYEDGLYREVTDALRTRYADEGFLEAQVEDPILRIDEGKRIARLHYRIDEGRRTHIERVEIPGAAAVEPADFLEGVPHLAPGQPLSAPRLRDARLRLQSAYARRGFLYASVELEVERPESNPWSATVRLIVNEGPEVHAGRILVQGNDRTHPQVIEEALLFEEGGVVGSEAISTSQQRLMRLGIFRTAAIRPIDPDVPEPVKDIVIDLRERPKHVLEVGGGVSVADGPRAFAQFTERNIFGRNLEFNARGRVNYQIFREQVRALDFERGLERYVDLGLRYPKIYGLGFDLGWRADLIHERDIRPAYEMTKYSILTGFDWPGVGPLSARLLFELESNDTVRSTRIAEFYGELSRRELEQLRFPDGETLLGSVRPRVTFDLRDDPVEPQAGFLAQVESDFASSLLGDPVEFVKVAGTLSGYVPLAHRTTLALSLGGGRIFQLNEQSETIWPRRFFMGGVDSVRGFTEDGLVPEDRRASLRQQIADCSALVFGQGCSDPARYIQQGASVPSDGGDLYLLARGELRFPVRGSLMGGVFFDAGNLWLDTAAFDPLRLRTAAGFGLRYSTPVGPIALDLGFNLRPDKTLNEDPMALHFSIGLF